MKTFHELINASLPETMVQHLYSLSGGADWVAGLAVREEPPLLARLPRQVAIHTRGAVIQVERVHLIVLLLQIQGGPLYETFVSRQHEDSLEYIERMADQERFSILMFDGQSSQPARAFVTRNGFQTLFTSIRQAQARWPAWTFPEFDRAKEILYTRYPTVTDLWQALQVGGGGQDGVWPACQLN